MTKMDARVLTGMLLLLALVCSGVAQPSTPAPPQPPVNCTASEFRCSEPVPGLGRCIPASWLCDGFPACPAGDDELNCTGAANRTRAPCDVAGGQFKCASTGVCMPNAWVCDNKADCPGTAEDEYYMACVWYGKMLTLSAIRQKLTDNYNTNVLPTGRTQGSLNLTINLHVSDIDRLDEKGQSLDTTSIVSIVWIDSHLGWTTKEFDRDNLTMDVDSIWNPDISLHNSADPDLKRRRLFEAGKGRPRVNRNGTVVYALIEYLSTKCGINPAYFPFDHQTCQIEFYSTGYDEHELQYVCGQAGYTVRKGGQWNIQNITCQAQPHMVVFTLRVLRDPTFYMITLVAPCVLISFLVPLTFLLPAEAGEKIGFSITLMLTLTVFLLILGDVMPTSPQMPLMGQYLLAIMYLSGASIMTSILVINCHFCCCARRASLCFRRKHTVPSEKDDESEQKSWQKVARVIDIVLFVFFLCVTLGIYFYILKE